jgi:cytochrome c553
LAACNSTYADDEPKHFGHDHDTMARFHMHENYALYGAIEHLLVHDKLTDARDLARSIGVAQEDAGLQPWSAYAATVRERALALADATTVDAACRRAASLVEACAACHLEANAVPEFRAPPPLPSRDDTVEARMVRHVWAVERIREGVVGGVEEPWLAGLDVLARSPLPWPQQDDKRNALAAQIHDLAARAKLRRATDRNADRARVYGEILATCAGCHAVADPAVVQRSL